MNQVLTSPPPATRLAWAFAVGLVALAALIFLRFKHPGVLFFPLLALGGAYLGSRLFAQPVKVLGIFLFLVVNLDFIPIGDTALTLDILVTLGLMWALVLRFGLEKQPLFTSAIEKAFLVYLAVALLSALFGVSLGTGLRTWIRMLEYLLLYSFVRTLRLTDGDKRYLVGAVLLSSIVPCLLGLLGMWQNIPSLYGLETPVGGGESVKRISSTLRHPVSFSLYLALTAALAMSFYLNGRWFRRSWLAPLLLLQMTLLYLTFGRTGWIVFAVAMAALLWIRGMKRILFFGAPVALAAVIVLLPTFLDRWQTAFQTDTNNSFLWRIGLWAYTITLVPARPLLGSGPGTFTEYVAYDTGKPSHQTWLGILVEMGAIGLLAFVVLIVLVGRQLRRRHKELGGTDPLVVAMIALYSAFLVGSIAEHPFALPVLGVYLWTLFALALSPGSGPASARAGL